MTTSIPPRVGLRVRRTVRTAAHPSCPIGQLGTIDVVHENGQDFWVATDEGGFSGWTSYANWQPVALPRAALLKAGKACELCGNTRRDETKQIIVPRDSSLVTLCRDGAACDTRVATVKIAVRSTWIF